MHRNECEYTYTIDALDATIAIVGKSSYDLRIHNQKFNN